MKTINIEYLKGDLSHKNSCAPIALSFVTGLNYNTVNHWLKTHYYNKPKYYPAYYNKPKYYPAYDQSIKQLIPYRKTDRSGTHLNKVPIQVFGLVEHYGKGWTLGKFIESHPKGTFIIRVNGHALSLKDGIVYDTGLTGPRKRIKQVFKKDENISINPLDFQ